MDVYTDPVTGRAYTVDPVTGRSRWLDQPPPPNLQDTQELPLLTGRGGRGRAGRPARGRLAGYGDGQAPVIDHRERVRGGRAGAVAAKALGVLVVLLVLVTALALVVPRLAARSGSDGAAPSSPPAATRTAPPPAPAVAGVGAPVRDGRLEFTVTGTRTETQLGNALIKTTAEGRFVLVSIRVRNVSDQPRSFVSIAQRLYDTQDRDYAANPGAAAYLGDITNLFERLDPGDSAVGTLVFDVPVDATPDRIELHDSLLSGGVEVALR